MSSGEIKLSDFDGTIHFISYTHADVAWVHTRAWHIDRYVRALDEILDMMDAYPDYCYYIDTWTELMIPYIKLRPQNLDRLRKYIQNGQMAVCSGHYGNVRSTNVGDETYIRNLQQGMKHWREFEPSVNLQVCADMDVTFGHTQLPQILGLADITGYFVERSIAALDSEDVPRAFVWKGLSGDEILVCRAFYGGLYNISERHGPTWDTDWDAVVDSIWKGYLERPIQDGVDNVALCVGSDDTRPDRLLPENDEIINYRELINVWNERSPGKMLYSTPDRLFSALEAERDKLQTIGRVLDPTDVSYNTANHGRRGIWWLREKNDRLLVQGEVVNTIASIIKGAEYPQNEYTILWEKLLDWTPHAVQYLFRQDWQAGELDLMKTADSAEKLIEAASSSLVGSCLPMDSDGIALINTLPRKRKEIVPIWVINTELTRDIGIIRDVDGNTVPFQVVDYPVCNAELNILAEVDVPSCGYTILKYEWDTVPPKPAGAAAITNAETAPYWRTKYNMLSKTAIKDAVFELSSNRIKITFNNGYLVSVEDTVNGVKRVAPDGSSFLEPVYYSVKKENWYTESISDEPERFVVDEMRLDHSGPLMWRVTRTGKVCGYWVRQHIDLYKDEAGVRSTIQFMAPSDNISSFLAIALPITDSAKVEVDIPFGIEPRNFDEIKYGSGERVIPGFFWARTWANASDSDGQIALVAEDGDKFFRAFGSPRKLVHILAQKTKVFEESWEGYIDTHDVGGRQVFQHRMMFGQESIDLMRTAEQMRHPIRYQYVPENMIGISKEAVRVSPDTLSMNSFVAEDGGYILRLTQMCGDSAQVEVSLPFTPATAYLVDLNGKVLDSNICCQDDRITFTIKAWQIATIKIIGKQGSIF
jgi:hypothetical protein